MTGDNLTPFEGAWQPIAPGGEFEADATTTLHWTIPFTAEDGTEESGEFSVGAAWNEPPGQFAEPAAPAESDGPPTEPASPDPDPAAGEEAAGDPADPQTEHPTASYVLTVNGADRPVTDAWLGESLLYVLRERLGLAGAKDGCEQGECGACSVEADGRLIASCLMPAAVVAGCEIRTVEGLSHAGQPCDIQRALAASGAVQCGFCVPGMAMTIHNLLEGTHRPTEVQARQALSGNLCRCSGYRGVLEAVREVVAARETAVAREAPADGAWADGASGDGCGEALIPQQSTGEADGGSA